MAESKDYYYPDTLQQIQLSSVQVNLAQELLKTEDLAEELKEITSLYNVAVGVGSTLKLEEVIWRLYKECWLCPRYRQQAQCQDLQHFRLPSWKQFRLPFFSLYRK